MKDRFQGSRGLELGAVLVAFVVIIALAFGAGPIARNVFLTVVSPVADYSEYAGLSRDALILRVKTAESKLSASGYQSALLSNLAEENRELRKLAGAREIDQGVSARVIARPPKTLYDSLLIDVGTDSGITAGDYVVYEGAYLGVIESVDEKTALARLASSPGSTQDVIVGDPRAVSIAKGAGGGAYELSVSRDVAVMSGDVVVFAGDESLVLGIVRSVIGDELDTTQQVLFSTPVSIAQLQFVRVIPRLETLAPLVP